MKKLNILFLLIIMLGFGIQAGASKQYTTYNEPAAPQVKQLAAANCPKDCSSCWDQCTTDDNCGSGHKCIYTVCGNRCVKKEEVSGDLTSCIIVAASGGQECPATSGKYCPAEFPVCCMIKGSWRCVAKLSDCHD
jgi:hypothetical protein